MSKRIEFLVSGEVQGVSFRWFTQKRATEYNITGFVRNDATNRVAGEAQGTPSSIEKLLTDLGRGPTLAKVEKLYKKDIPVVEHESSEFEIRR